MVILIYNIWVNKFSKKGAKYMLMKILAGGIAIVAVLSLLMITSLLRAASQDDELNNRK